MSWWKHAVVGAIAGVLPDAALALYGWRRRRLGDDEVPVRVHRVLHGARGLVLAVGLAYASHLVADRLTKHRLPAWVFNDEHWCGDLAPLAVLAAGYLDVGRHGVEVGTG